MNQDIFQKEFIANIKGKIRAAQYEALKVVNVKLIDLYWEIGKSLSESRRKVGENQSCRLCPESCSWSFRE